MTARPFDDFRALLPLLPEASEVSVAAVRARDARLTKPAGSLGRLEEIVEFLAAWQAKAQPTVERPTVAVFAANHGVAAQGVSAWPSSVTRQMVTNFGAGGAAINQICGAYGAGLKVFELALDIPTRDITQEPAMTEAECAATIAFGMEAISGADLLGLGEMGVANTTSAAALYCALYGGRAQDWVGRGAGVDDAGLARKIAAVERAVALHGAHRDDPLELLRRLGGREIAALAGAILAARMERVPVLLDGYVVCAAAAVLQALDPATIAWPRICRRRARMAMCCVGWARSRCSISACVWARGPGRVSLSASRRPRSPAGATWRRSKARACPAAPPDDHAFVRSPSIPRRKWISAAFTSAGFSC